MSLDELLEMAPRILDELTRELFRRANVSMLADAKSQLTACFQLGLRSASLMQGMAEVLHAPTEDSFEVLNRAAIEARDLLMHFRFDDQATRNKVAYWFAGAKDNSWKADLTKIDEFLTKQGAIGIQLADNWGRLSVLSHPTTYAATNSTVVIVDRITGRTPKVNMTHKRADYLVGISRLIMATTYELPGWIPLGIEPARIPGVEPFSQLAEIIGSPILDGPLDNPLPAHSIRPPKKP